MDMEYSIGLMGRYMKVGGKMGFNKEKESSRIKEEMSREASGRMEKE